MPFQPITDRAKFEELCAELYQREWNDANCKVVGRTGQSQFGLDILGTRSGRNAGIQCKCYTKTRFTVKTITDDLVKVDQAHLDVSVLLFATTKDRDQKVTLAVDVLSRDRKAAGLCTVEVSFWQEIEILLQKYPDIAARYYKNHELSIASRTLNAASEANATLTSMREEAKVVAKLTESRLENLTSVTSEFVTLLREQRVPQAQERLRLLPDYPSPSTAEAHYSATDLALSTKLDVVKNFIVQLKTTTAREVLMAAAPNPSTISNEYLRFRYLTNLAAIDALSGNIPEAYANYEKAYQTQPANTKAIGNYVRAQMQTGRVDDARALCDQALAVHSDNAGLWSLRITLEGLDEDGLASRAAPFGIVEHHEVQYALGAVALARSDYAVARKYFERCFNHDTKSIEARRSLLTSTVHLLSIKGAAEDSSMLCAADRAQIELALAPIDETLVMLKGIEANEVALEFNNNAHIALQMLGDDGRADQLAAEVYSRFPNAPSILRAVAEKRTREGHWKSLKAELFERMPNLSGACRAGIGELALMEGDLEWFEECRRHPLPADDIEIANLLLVLEVLTKWQCGQKDAALKELKALANAKPSSVFVVVALSKLEAKHGHQVQALTRLREAVVALVSSGHVRERLTLADGLYEMQAFADVAELLSGLVATPRDDRTTRRLVESLLRSGQLHKAKTILQQLSGTDRQGVAIRRLEIELAHQTGDFDALLELLKQEFERTPTDAVIATNYAGILLSLDHTNDLSLLLQTNPQFKNSHPKHVFEFAKIEINCGFEINGHARLYELWRAHPNDAFVAQCFFSQQMINHDPEVLRAEHKTSGSFAVRVSASGVQKWIAVDQRSQRNGTPWPECIASTDPFAKALSAAVVGQSIQRNGGFFPIEVKVLDFYPMRRFALEKARELVENNTSPSSLVQSINVDAMGIDKFVTALTDMAHSREKAVNRAFELYKRATHEQPQFLNFLMRIVDTDAYGLIHGWPYAFCQMQISTGERDRQAAMRVALDSASAVTVDLLVLLELQRLNALSALVRPNTEVLVPRSVMEQLRYMRMLHAPRSGATARVGTFGTNNGRPFFSDQPPSRDVIADLEMVCKFVQTRCKIVPVIGPATTTNEDRALLELLDSATASSIKLCQERQIPLVTLDCFLAEFLRECYDLKVLDLPLLVSEAHREQLVTSQHRAAIVAKLVESGRSFVGASSWDLFYLAVGTPHAANSSVEKCIRVCEGKNVEVANAMFVMRSFFQLAAKNGVAARVVGHYAFTLRNALKFVRREAWPPLRIDLEIIDALEQIYGPKGEQLPMADRMAMQRVLTRNPSKRFACSPLW